jgi:uncharacterized lipoprotein NlpE involved in copper resistance
MFKKVVATVLIITMCSASLMGCNGQEEARQNKDVKPQATVETCEFLSEWDSTLFEVFGFDGLQLPYNAYYPKIEKGRTYVNAEFHVDSFVAFEDFFRLIYVVMWGEINDIKQILKYENYTYSFEGDYVVTEIYRDATAVKPNIGRRAEKYAFIKISYDEASQIVKLECKLLKEPSTKAN